MSHTVLFAIRRERNKEGKQSMNGREEKDRQCSVVEQNRKMDDSDGKGRCRGGNEGSRGTKAPGAQIS